MTITLAPTNPPKPGTPANQVFPTVQISHPNDHLSLPELLDLVIKPALIAWEFNPTTVAKIVFDEDGSMDFY